MGETQQGQEKATQGRQAPRQYREREALRCVECSTDTKRRQQPIRDRNALTTSTDDILSYMGPSLERHAGCDIIDIYPGAGLWSRKLHEMLQPRSHILLEPDEAVYRPFLEPLLGKPNTTLVPKSGIIWRDLSSVLDAAHLPQQVEQSADETPQRNNTLLVTGSLAFFPKRRFAMFESVTQLVLYQFINSIRASSLFNKYGLVRMLLWVESSDRHGLLARSCQRRRRLAIDGELATDWITEVAGPDDTSRWFMRDHRLDLASCRQTLARMAQAGIRIPPGRESRDMREVLASSSNSNSSSGGKNKADLIAEPGLIERPFREEQRKLDAKFEAGKIKAKSAEHRRLIQLQYRSNRETKVAETIHSLVQQLDGLANENASVTAADDSLSKRETEWNQAIDAMPASTRKEFALYRDNLHVFLQDPPVLTWDRRSLEPLVSQDTEFFPNVPCALLDIQPKAMHPRLRSMGPGSDRSGDIFEMILRGMMAMGAEPIGKAIDSVWPGAAEGVLPHCPSLHNRHQGGTAVGGYGELSSRTLNEKQWIEILDAWMKWPFRPSLAALVARIAEEGDTDLEDDVPAVD